MIVTLTAVLNITSTAVQLYRILQFFVMIILKIF